MPHIFISYAKKDTKPLAMDLADRLSMLEGITVWVDRDIEYGDFWKEAIEDEIDRCDFMVVLCSPDINRHKVKKDEPISFVRIEADYAEENGKIIIPVIAQVTKLPMSLTKKQAINYIGESLTVDELVNRLCKRMKITPTQKATVVYTISSVGIPPKPKIILPQPFDWCYIPSGKVTLTPDATDDNSYIKENTVMDVVAFWMAKYPITNAQYREFVYDGGYQNNIYWNIGQEWRIKNSLSSPRYWNDEKWNADDFPVVGVSYYEAIAFCLWLSKKLNQRIRLPTDTQWQYTMQSDDRRLYPWGNEWDRNKCNTRELQILKTTPVTFFEPKGNSPYGVVDMGGNVWQWCLTSYESGENDKDEKYNNRVLRGSSWNGQKEHITIRHKSVEPYSWYDLGFRIACLID